MVGLSPVFQELGGVIGGLLVGFSLGLTGGGGSIFAVPILIYALGVPVRTAIGLSLAVVGLTAGFGAAMRLRAGDVDLRAGVVFSIAGMVFAPLGSWLGGFVPGVWLLSVFAILMGFVGWRMWSGKGENADVPGPCVLLGNGRLGPGCHVRLSLAGAVAGVLSGLFGIGGGFVIVPALLYVTGTSIHRAVATSLMVIFLISISGVAAKVVQGLDFPMPLAVLFPLGGLAGMLAGGALRSRLSGPALRRVFAAAMWVVAAWMLWQRGA